MQRIRFFGVVSLTATLFFITPAFADNTYNNLPKTIAKDTLTLAQDTAITTYLYAKLATKPTLAHDNIDITTTEGKVTLNGIVTNDTEAQTATQLIESTSGVKSVDASQLLITQGHMPPLMLASASQLTTVSANEDPILASAQAADQQQNTKPLQLSKSSTSDPAAANLQKVKATQHSRTHHKISKKKKTLKKTKKAHPKHHSKHKKHHAKHPSKKSKKTKVKPPQTHTASANDTKNHFLNTALMTNKTIPAG